MNKIKEFLQREYRTLVLEYFDTITSDERRKWLSQICKIYKSDPELNLQDIRLVKEYIEEKVNILENERNHPGDDDTKFSSFQALRKDIKWSSAIYSPSQELQESMKSLQFLIGDRNEWGEFEEKLDEEVNKLAENPRSEEKEEKKYINLNKIVVKDSDTQNKLNLIEEEHFDFWNNKLRQLEAFENLYPVWTEICELFLKTSKVPHNYKGELSDECLKKLRELREKMPKAGIDKFCKAAYTQYPECRYAFSEKDGEKEKNKLGDWTTLRYKLKTQHHEMLKKK